MASSKKEDSIFSEIKFNFPLMLSYIFLGMLVAEIFIVVDMLVRVSFSYVTGFLKTEGGWIITFTYLAGLYLGLLNMNSYKKLKLAIKSRRFDIFIFILLGIALTWTYKGFGVFSIKIWIDYLSGVQISVLLILPFIIIGITYLQIYINKKAELRKKKDEKDKSSNFMSDLAEEKRENDKFDLTNQANNFAENVYNNGSKESLVFGIDAPWGSGKSTFVNFCKEYWEEKYKEQIIVYNFDVLRYEDEDNLFNKFVDGLIKEIKNNMFAPELESLISKYAKILTNSKATISLGPFRFGSPIEEESIDKIIDRLKDTLKTIDYKIIIIIDDLDRLNFSSIKEILFVIKKAFTFPNISYVLCYDTENISSLEQKMIKEEKVSEFLEKFINIKTNLFSDIKLLENYFELSKNESLKNNILADPELVEQAIEGLKDIFKSKDFHLYIPFVGDARKLKRLVNVIILLELEKTDFKNSDFDKHDLIHLILIYINYPQIFRKIYNTEMNMKYGFFSLVTSVDDGYPKDEQNNKRNELTFKNSLYFNEYLKQLTTNQKFLVGKVFDAEQRIDNNGVSKLSELILSSYACFNNPKFFSKSRNLESYLNLIVHEKKPIAVDQHNFYIQLIEKIIKESNVQILDEYSQEVQYQFFRVLVNLPEKEVSIKKSHEIINYILEKLKEYPFIRMSGIVSELRRDFSFILVKLLNEIGWIDEEGIHYKNTDKNILSIAHWIFGEGNYKQAGILDTLGQENRGVLGLYDLLLFRLRCCMNRGSDISNVSRSLIFHSNSRISSGGIIEESLVEEMRLISQKVFKNFKRRYIDIQKNIFEEISLLSFEEVLGKESEHLYTELKNNNFDDENINKQILIFKNSTVSFIIDQLGNISKERGIGCGFYDSEGTEDKKKINTEMNRYLFEICFNPLLNIDNYKYFLNYLITSTISARFYSFEEEWNPKIENFTSLIDETLLINYWKENSEDIKSQGYEKENNNLFLSDNIMTYKEELPKIYELLDRTVSEEV